jgi:hypothetical protein
VAADAADDRLFLDLGRPEVAEIAGRRGDGDVVSLDDLGVAARAAELLAATQLTEMVRVIDPYEPVTYFTTWLAACSLPIASALMPGA